MRDCLPARVLRVTRPRRGCDGADKSPAPFANKRSRCDPLLRNGGVSDDGAGRPWSTVVDKEHRRSERVVLLAKDFAVVETQDERGEEEIQEKKEGYPAIYIPLRKLWGPLLLIRHTH